MSEDLATLITSMAARARAASLALAVSPTRARNAALVDLAGRIDRSHGALTAANRLDLAAAQENGLSAAQVDRLTLTPARLTQLAESVRQVAALPDPLGEVLDESTRPNGLRLRKVRVPIGVIGIIYEARPNVTVDCAVLCLKSGNASLQYCCGRVLDAGVTVAFSLKVEERGGMVGAVESVGDRLVDWHRHGLRRRIGIIAAVYCDRLSFHRSVRLSITV